MAGEQVSSDLLINRFTLANKGTSLYIQFYDVILLGRNLQRGNLPKRYSNLFASRDVFGGVSKDKIQCLNCELLERISGDVISDTLVDVSKDKTLFTLLNCPSKVTFKDTILDMSSDTLTKRVVAMVNCNMMSLAKVRNFHLSGMKGCKSYYIPFT